MTQKKSPCELIEFSPNSLILEGKVTADKIVFIRVLVLVSDGTLRNVFGYFIKSEPYENTGKLRMKMSRL